MENQIGWYIEYDCLTKKSKKVYFTEIDGKITTVDPEGKPGEAEKIINVMKTWKKEGD